MKILKYLSTFCLVALAIYLNIIRHEMRYQREMFTPRIKETYRPLVRNGRLYAEEVFSNKKDDINRLFRQFGLS
jgi:hypothetical protein